MSLTIDPEREAVLDRDCPVALNLPTVCIQESIAAMAVPEPQSTNESGAAEPAAAFRALGLSEQTLRAVQEAGFEEPTPVQSQSIPILQVGNDLIAQAQTGTGKTAAFALPLADMLDASQRHTQAIILAPTRELCVQVAEETLSLTRYRGLRVVPIYGGQPIERQFRALSYGPQIVVGTPGRVLDHINRKTLDLSRIRVVVLDEADEMLNMGFLDDVEAILKETPAERQTALFSATIPPRIAALARDYLRDPKRVTVESKQRTVEQITQTYYEVAASQKVEALSRILAMAAPTSTILFCRTRRDVDELGEALQSRGYEAETLHGEMNQAARDRVMSRFRTGQADLLIATDVAARGLDIDQVTHVINYDIPWDVENYIHRIGRTGRAGRSGEAITLISPRERRQLKMIERFINAPIRLARVPTSADIATRRREKLHDELRTVLTEGNTSPFRPLVDELTAGGAYDAAAVAAAALHLLSQARKAPEEGAFDDDQLDAESEPGMTRLFLQVGRQDGIRAGDIVGAIANEAGVSGNAIGAIDILDKSTFVDVPSSDAPAIIRALGQAEIRGRRIFVDIARPRPEEGPDFRSRRSSRPEGRGGYDRPREGGFRRDNRPPQDSRFGDRPRHVSGYDQPPTRRPLFRPDSEGRNRGRSS